MKTLTLFILLALCSCQSHTKVTPSTSKVESKTTEIRLRRDPIPSVRIPPSRIQRFIVTTPVKEPTNAP